MRLGPFDPAAFSRRWTRPAVTLTPTLVGEARTGLWCDACALPSRVQWDVELRAQDGSVVPPALICNACPDCGVATLDRSTPEAP